MPGQLITKACPYLALQSDPRSHFADPDGAHHCYSPASPGEVTLEYQKEFCFSSNYPACKRFVELTTPAAIPLKGIGGRPWTRGTRLLRLPIAVLVSAIGLFLLMLLFAWASTLLLSRASSVVLSTTTSTRLALTLTASPTTSPLPTSTETRTPRAIRTLAPLVIPTPPTNGTILTLSPDPSQTGWVASRDSVAHWGEGTMLVGSFQNQIFAGILQFDLTGLPPKSQILFAVLEITGRDASRLGSNGEWKVENVDGHGVENWDQVSFDDVMKLSSIGSVGQPMSAVDLTAGYVNRVEFDNRQRQLFENQLDNSKLILRVVGPVTGENLFTWDAGGKGSLNPPTLYIVAVPGPLTVVTSTPTPVNVLTAAAVVGREATLVRERGTPTRIPRSVVTATPEARYEVVTSIPTPDNPAAIRATAVYATAVAMTTGTFTPLPPSWATPTPMPLVIPRASLTRVPSPTPTKRAPTLVELAQKPLPPELYNKIVFKEGPRTNPNIWVMDPDGTNVGLLTDRSIYDIAQARDTMSPDGKRHAYNAYWGDIIQIWSVNFEYPAALPDRLSDIKAGYAYAPAWSPDGNKIAYVVANKGIDDIYVWDWEARKSTRLTFGDGKNFWWAQFPSYSPDGMHIVFSSDMGHDAAFSEIWTMNADGTDALWRGNGEWDAYAPIWIKWKR